MIIYIYTYVHIYIYVYIYTHIFSFYLDSGMISSNLYEEYVSVQALG